MAAGNLEHHRRHYLTIQLHLQTLDTILSIQLSYVHRWQQLEACTSLSLRAMDLRVARDYITWNATNA